MLIPNRIKGQDFGVFGDAAYCSNLKHYDVLYMIWLANFFWVTAVVEPGS